MGLSMVAGSPLSRYENDTSQHVAIIDTTTAAALGISAARLASHPAVFVGGIAYTVIGVYSSAQRVVTDESAMLIPENTALADFGNPEPGIGNQNEAQMVVATRIGAAHAVARQIAAAELPTDPSRLVVTSPPNPQNLQSEVSGDLAGLFLILALISLHAQRRQAAAPLLRPGRAVPRGVHPLRRARPVQQRRPGAQRVK
jgi:putative ABC transport system permease protein